jgi:hypothetical protein
VTAMQLHGASPHRSATALLTLLLLPLAGMCAACDIAGRWRTGALSDGIIYIGDDLTGWYDADSGTSCHVRFPHVVASPIANGFHLSSAWNNASGCLAFTADLTFDWTCEFPSGTYYNSDGTSWTITLYLVTLYLEFSAGGVNYIPANASAVSSGNLQLRNVYIKNSLILWLHMISGPGIADERPRIKSSRLNNVDDIEQAKDPTNALGLTTAHISTKDEHTLGGAFYPEPDSGGIISPPGANQYYHPWLPANYTDLFHQTCYVTALESNHHSGALVAADGLPSELRFHQDFLNEVHENGTGVAYSQPGYTTTRIKALPPLPGHSRRYGWAPRDDCTTGALNLNCLNLQDTLAVNVDKMPYHAAYTLSSWGSGLLASEDKAGDLDDDPFHVDIFFDDDESGCTLFGSHDNVSATIQHF